MRRESYSKKEIEESKREKRRRMTEEDERNDGTQLVPVRDEFTRPSYRSIDDFDRKRTNKTIRIEGDESATTTKALETSETVAIRHLLQLAHAEGTESNASEEEEEETDATVAAVIDLRKKKSTGGFKRIVSSINQGRSSQDAIVLKDDLVAVIDGHGKEDDEKFDRFFQSFATKGDDADAVNKCRAAKRLINVFKRGSFVALDGTPTSFNEQAKRATRHCRTSGACMSLARIGKANHGDAREVEIFSIGDCTALVIAVDGVVKHVQRHHAHAGYAKPPCGPRRVETMNAIMRVLKTGTSADATPTMRMTSRPHIRYGTQHRSMAMYASYGDNAYERQIHDGALERIPVVTGDLVVLCSDGCTDMWHIDDIAMHARAAFRSANPQGALREFVRKTLIRWTRPVWKRILMDGSTQEGVRWDQRDDISIVVAQV